MTASAKEKIIVAVDAPDASSALRLVEPLAGEGCLFKIGLQLFTAEGPSIVSRLQSTGARIIPVHAKFSRCLRMKTWDGFIIPLPFSEVSVTIDDALPIPGELTGEEFEEKRKNLEDLLKHAAD
jgi:hypothetical protein